MVKHIMYKEKKYPVRLSYYALKKTKEESVEKGNADDANKVSMETILNGDVELFEPLLFYSLVAGAKAEGIPFTLPRDEAEWILDECFNEFVKLVPLFFQLGEEAAEKPETNLTPKKKKRKK